MIGPSEVYRCLPRHLLDALPFITGDSRLSEDEREQADSDVAAMGIRNPHCHTVPSHDHMPTSRKRPFKAKYP